MLSCDPDFLQQLHKFSIMWRCINRLNSLFVFLCRDASRIPFRRLCAGPTFSNSTLRLYRNCFRFRSPAYVDTDQADARLNQVVKVVHQAQLTTGTVPASTTMSDTPTLPFSDISTPIHLLTNGRRRHIRCFYSLRLT